MMAVSSRVSRSQSFRGGRDGPRAISLTRRTKASGDRRPLLASRKPTFQPMAATSFFVWLSEPASRGSGDIVQTDSIDSASTLIEKRCQGGSR